MHNTTLSYYYIIVDIILLHCVVRYRGNNKPLIADVHNMSPGDGTKQRDEGKREIKVTESDIQGEI